MRQDQQASALTLSSVVTRNENIVYTDLDDAIVMMDVDDGSYHELDPVGARIWMLLEAPRSVAEICESLLAEYDVDPQTCQADTSEFLQSGFAKGLFHMQST